MAIPEFLVAKGVIDGSNRTFTVDPYLPNTTAVFLNGQLKRQDLTDGWVETNPVAGIIVMDVPPSPGDNLQVFFLSAAPVTPELEEIVRIRGNMSLLPENALQSIRGASKTIRLKVELGHPKIPVDLTGARVIFTVKKFQEDPLPTICKTTDDPSQILVTDTAHGEVEIFLYPNDTQGLDPGQFIYDVWVVLVSTKRYAVIPPTPFWVLPSVSWIP